MPQWPSAPAWVRWIAALGISIRQMRGLPTASTRPSRKEGAEICGSWFVCFGAGKILLRKKWFLLLTLVKSKNKGSFLFNNKRCPAVVNIDLQPLFILQAVSRAWTSKFPRGWVSEAGIIRVRELVGLGRVLSLAAANAHLGTQSAEAPRRVPLQDQGPLDLRCPGVRLPSARRLRLVHFPQPLAHPLEGVPGTLACSGDHRTVSPAGKTCSFWDSDLDKDPFSMCLPERRARSLGQETGYFLTPAP